MPVSEIDTTVALIVIDLQNGTLSGPTAHPVDSVLAHTAELIDAFHLHGLPVVFATVTGTPAGTTEYGAGSREFPASFSELSASLDKQETDLLLARSTWSAFAGTDLESHLRTLGVTQIVLTGIATSFGVESTARAAYDLGYNVIIALDAVTDRSMDAHSSSSSRVFPALGQISSAGEIAALLS